MVGTLSLTFAFFIKNHFTKGAVCGKKHCHHHHHRELVRLWSLKTCSIIAPGGALGLSIFVMVSLSLSFHQVDI
jgi:hypothetical protein